MLNYISALPQSVIYVIGGALGGGLGSVFATLANELSGTKWLGKVVFSLTFAAGITLPNLVSADSSGAQSTDQVMEQLRGNRLFADIFKLHPEAEKQLRDKMAEVADGSLGGDRLIAAEFAAGQIVDRYFFTDLLSSSDEAVNKYVAYNFTAMQNLQDSPELCVKYFMSDHRLSRNEMNMLHLDDEVNAKAAVIESASPPTPIKRLTAQETFAAVGEAYRTFALDKRNLVKLAHIRELPPQQGCAVATEFSQALAMMDPNVRSNVFKNMIALAKRL